MAKRTPPRPVRKKASRPHRHGQGRCMHILKQLSAYIDDELPGPICAELRKHLGACPNCEEFVASLRQTVALCQHQPAPRLSAADRAAMRAAIVRATRPR
ncbi:MAG: zf-HC2 domain-containing protein [Nitrospira sp.]